MQSKVGYSNKFTQRHYEGSHKRKTEPNEWKIEGKKCVPIATSQAESRLVLATNT